MAIEPYSVSGKIDDQNVRKNLEEIQEKFNALLSSSSASGSYINRGDPVAVDFALAALTTDGAYHDLDLSAIVPDGAVAVNLFVKVQDDVTNSSVSFRKNGNTNSIAISAVRTQTANIIHDQTFTVACDTNRVIEYLATNTTFTLINITVLGWFIP